MSFVPAFRRTKAAGFWLTSVLIMTMVWSCSDSSTEPPPPNNTPSSVTPAAGTDNQTAVAGEAVAVAPSVTITNSDGSALNGKTVLFAVASGGGSVTPGTATTDAQGVATVTNWTLGTTAGTNTLLVTAGSATFTYTATGEAGPAASLAIEAGDGQSAVTGTQVTVPPAVKVVDGNSNPVPGTTVTFTAMNNSMVDGSSTATATSDANGIAAVTSWTLGDVGANTLEASGAGTPVVFSATSVGIPATVTVAGGDMQTQDAGTTLLTNPSVEVRDASNALLANIPVTFAVTGGGGSVTGPNATTNASGIASVGSWTLGTTPGANTLDATVAGIATPVTFTATGVVGPAAQIQITAGDMQTATVGAVLAGPVQATVQDQFGNAVASESLVFTPTDGTVDNTNVVSDANGNASVVWTLGTTTGTQTLDVTAAAGSVTPGAATATATADVAASLSKDAAGDNQSAVQGTAVAVDPFVTVLDQFNNPVPGVDVTFTPSGDGSVVNTTATSDAMGVASSGGWTLTSAPAANTLDASAAGVTTVTFDATATVQVGSIAIDAGDGQSATVGQTVAIPLRVLVLDVSSNPAPGIPVTFAVTLGGGSVTGATGVTDASGLLTLGSWTLGTIAGANEVEASVDSDPTALFALFNATGTTDTPTSMTVSAGDGQSAIVGTAVPIAPAVVVMDQFANPIAGTSVAFAASADGQVVPASVITDGSGVATVTSWTLATAAGANTLTATSPSVPDVVFNATGTVQTLVITILQGNDQTAPLTGPLPVNPTVRVTDQSSGLPAVGVDVNFFPRTGEGTVDNFTVVTDANGDAAVQWTPGRTGSNFMDVTSGNTSTLFFSIGSNSAYKVELVFMTGGETMAQKEAFGNAAGRWMDIVTGDLTDIDFGAGPGADACSFGEPNIPGIVDDLRIFVKLEPIDGPGNILGAAGPCFIRGVASPPQPLTIIGLMRFDTADLAGMEGAGTLGEVILHEMAHVLGSGTLWTQTPLSLLTNPSCSPDTPGADTHFTGSNALTEFAAITGGPWTGTAPTTSPVPVSNKLPATCPGSRDGHWRESTFDTELMTPFIAGPGNALSRTTIASMQDLGYTVDLGQADPYSLFSTTAVRANVASLIYLKDDIIRIPLKVVDRNGRVVGVTQH